MTRLHSFEGICFTLFSHYVVMSPADTGERRDAQLVVLDKWLFVVIFSIFSYHMV